ncbi:MAG: radical SAM protein [Treponema sp.]|nr:radical SAM protein [Treponema sp.]
MLNAVPLTHGGIMVNYRCNAACRHCGYSCSPTRSPASREKQNHYVDEESAEEICRFLRKGGCRSVHIGGGEPFLDFPGLIMMIQKLNQAGIRLEYIETNAFWAAGEANLKKARDMLQTLASEGGDCLCISIDPFHAEYVPYGAPIALAQLCDKMGMNYFLWKREFYSTLSKLNPEKIYTREEFEKQLSKDYINRAAKTYGIGYGGRASNIDKEYNRSYPAEDLIKDSMPCRRLLATGHFHVDLDACFIPPGCTGIRIPLSETVDGIPPGKYPAFDTLYAEGVAGLYKKAGEEGFRADPSGYTSKCNLCLHIRHYLSDREEYPELDRNHYEEAFKYY